eukprot:13271532-Alexandrium_andersonii.AAC.1
MLEGIQSATQSVEMGGTSAYEGTAMASRLANRPRDRFKVAQGGRAAARAGILRPMEAAAA